MDSGTPNPLELLLQTWWHSHFVQLMGTALCTLQCLNLLEKSSGAQGTEQYVVNAQWPSLLSDSAVLMECTSSNTIIHFLLLSINLLSMLIFYYYNVIGIYNKVYLIALTLCVLYFDQLLLLCCSTTDTTCCILSKAEKFAILIKVPSSTEEEVLPLFQRKKKGGGGGEAHLLTKKNKSKQSNSLTVYLMCWRRWAHSCASKENHWFLLEIAFICQSPLRDLCSPNEILPASHSCSVFLSGKYSKAFYYHPLNWVVITEK